MLVSPAHLPNSVLICAGVKRYCQAGGAGGEHETIGVLPPFSESSALLVDNPREVVKRMKKGKEDWRWLLGFAAKNLPAGLLFFISHLSLDQETERGPPALPDLELKGNPEINKVVQD